jgi:hypothetical protein
MARYSGRYWAQVYSGPTRPYSFESDYGRRGAIRTERALAYALSAELAHCPTTAVNVNAAC